MIFKNSCLAYYTNFTTYELRKNLLFKLKSEFTYNDVVNHIQQGATSPSAELTAYIVYWDIYIN